MSKKKAIEIAVRIYALYLLVQIPMALLGILPVFSLDNSKFIVNPALYRTWAIFNPFLYLLISLVLLAKAQLISRAIVGKEQENDTTLHETSPRHYQLSFWMTLLGLYLLVTYVSSIIRELMRTPIMASDHYMWSIVVPEGMVIVAAGIHDIQK